MMQPINGNGETCLLELVTGRYGSIEALFAVAEANNTSVDQVPMLGVELVAPEVEPVRVVSFAIKPKTLPVIVVGNGETALIDHVVGQYGSIEALFFVAEAMATSIDQVIPLGAPLVFPSVELPENKSLAPLLKEVIESSVAAWEDQTTVDLAMQTGGSFESIFEVAELNGISVDSKLTIGKRYKKATIRDDIIVKAFNDVRRPSSGDAPTLPVPGEGIEFWAIEDDFIVS